MNVTHDGDDEYQHEVCCDGLERRRCMTDDTKLSSEVSATTSSGMPSSSSQQPPVVVGRSSKDLLSEQFELYGWRPDPLLSDDENYLDLVFIITRNPARRRRRRPLVEEKGCSVSQTVVDKNDGGRGFCDEGMVARNDANQSGDDSPPDKKLTSSLSTATVGTGDDAHRTTKCTLSPIIPGAQEYQPQGHMGALIVRPMTLEKTPRAVDDDHSGGSRKSNKTCDVRRDLEGYEERFWESILGAGTNMPLFITDDNESGQNRDDADENRKKVRTAANKKTTKPKADIHAEISALGQACKSCQSTENCTAYITIHPCKNCFGALIAFGISRIVTRQAKQNWSSVTLRTALSKGLQIHTLTHDERRHQMERINQLVNSNTNEFDETGQNGIIGRTDEELMAMAEAKRQHRQERKLQAKKKRQEGHG